MNPGRVVATLAVATTLAGVSACSDDGLVAERAGLATAAVAPAAAASPTGPRVTALGVTVRGAFGSRPEVVIPAGSPAPSARRVDVLQPGTGPVIRAGDLLVTGYHVHAWATATSPSAVLEDTWTRGVPAIGPAGEASSTVPWGDVVVGRTVGTRLLVVLPRQGDWQAAAVVVDLVGVVDRAGTVGRAVRGRSAKGFPRVEGDPGTEPTVAGLDGVPTPSGPRSRLLVAGEGPEIARRGTLVVHLVEVDLPSGERVNSTWGGVPLLLPAAEVLARVTALDDARVGSRVVAVLPGSGAVRARVLVLDVLAQV